MAPPAAVPIRRDVYVYNEATGFLITSRVMGGRELDSDDQAWTVAVRAGDLLPIELVQDDSFIIRVVASDELTPQESEEWVGRLAWRLRVPDGRLAVTGGVEFVMDPIDDDEVATSEFVRLLDLPAGDYDAVVYAYLNGVNGEYLLDQAALKGGEAEPAGAFFRRTRPGEEFPLWLRHWCVAYPDKDPGHEDEWADQPVPDERPEFVDFLLHLTPLRGEPGDLPPLEQGFFSFNAFAVRKPLRCPAGLEARDVLRPAMRVQPPTPLQTVDVHSLVAAHALSPVAGGPVELPLERLVRAYRLAWFSTDSVVPELRAALPAGAAWMPAIAGLEMGAAASAIEGGVRIGFADAGGKWTTLGWLVDIGAQLARLPDGSTLELMTAQTEPDGDPLVGVLRFRGPVAGGVWRITEAFPPVAAARLREALDLAAQQESGTALTLPSAQRAKAVQDRFLGEWALLVEKNPLTRAGRVVRPAKPDSSVIALLAIEAFRLEFADTWRIPAAEDDFDLADIFASAAGLKRPTKGERILEGTAGRVHYRGDLGSLGDKVAKRVEEAERAMTALGYELVGDIACSAMSDIVFRGYARPAGDTWAVLIQGAFGPDQFHFITRFEQDAVLTTNRSRMANDDVDKKDFRTAHHKADLATLHAHHETRKAELAARYGRPVRVTPELPAFARAIDDALARDAV